jgi:hypothetical protein
MFIVKDSIKWGLFAATVLSILLAWGKNFPGFTEFFLHYIPAYNKFRAVSMTLVIAEFTMPILAMLAVREIVKNPQEVKAKMKFFYISFALTAGIALMVYITPTTFVTPVPDSEIVEIRENLAQQKQSPEVAEEVIANLETARLGVVTSDALRTFLFILFAAAALYFYIRKPYGIMPLAGALTLLLMIDMWGVGSRYLYDRNAKETKYEKAKKNEARFFADGADKFIFGDKKSQGADSVNFRVANLTGDPWSDGATSYFHKSIGGYHGAKLKRIQELYEQKLKADFNSINYAVQTPFADSLLEKESILNMMNTKYILYYQYNEKGQPQGDENGDPLVYTNPHACGSAWFVPELKVVKNADEEITAVKNFNPKQTAIVDARFQPLIGDFKSKGTEGASIKIISCEPNYLKYQYNAPSEQLAVFSEMYYDKGWNAYVDGKLTPHFRANYVLRAMKVPAGSHTVEFKFDGTFYESGEKIALFGSIFLFLFVGGGIYMDIKKKKEQANQAA